MPTTHANYKPKGYTPKDKQPSLTQPGQVLSIRAISDRFRRGQGVLTYPAGYNPDVPAGLEYLNKLDRIDLMRQNASNISQIRQTLSDQERQRNAQKPQAPTTEAAHDDSEGERGAVKAPLVGADGKQKQQ